MIGYASNTGTRRNLNALRIAGWRILLTPDNSTVRAGLKHGIDNGAWKAHQQKTAFDCDGFSSLVDRHGSTADFVVIPDIVAGGNASLDFSLSWLPGLVARAPYLLLPVQDGMDPGDVQRVLSAYPRLGIFLGGSTEYKLSTMYDWGIRAASMQRWFHVGRVNTARRIRLCAEAGATSFDGTSATMFSCTLPLLDTTRRQPSLLTPNVSQRERGSSLSVETGVEERQQKSKPLLERNNPVTL